MAPSKAVAIDDLAKLPAEFWRVVPETQEWWVDFGQETFASDFRDRVDRMFSQPPEQRGS